jgi:methionyl-tRNA formyltransferase
MTVPVRRDGSSFAFSPALPGERLRVLVLTSDDPHHLYLQSELGASLDVCGAVVEPGAEQQRRLWRRGRRVDWAARFWQVERQRLTGRSRFKQAYFGPMTDDARIETIPRLVAASANDTAAVDWIRAIRPDVSVVCGTMYLGRSVLAHTGLTINVHGGCLPDYRGNHAVFFAYCRRDYEKIAATLHLVTPKLDGGEIVEVVYPDLRPGDDDERLYCRSVHAAIDRLRDILLELEAGATVRCYPQPYEGVMFRHRDRTPLRELVVWTRRRAGWQRVPDLPARTRSTYDATDRPAPRAAA